MVGALYENALALADNDQEILDDVHTILMKEGLTEQAYAQVFVLIFHESRGEEDRISYYPPKKMWRKGKEAITDVKLFTALNQCCDLIYSYVMASWENCVFSAWLPKREKTKAEREMDAMESLAHARAILNQASSLMSDASFEPSKDWGMSDGDDDSDDDDDDEGSGE